MHALGLKKDRLPIVTTRSNQLTKIWLFSRRTTLSGLLPGSGLLRVGLSLAPTFSGVHALIPRRLPDLFSDCQAGLIRSFTCNVAIPLLIPPAAAAELSEVVP